MLSSPHNHHHHHHHHNYYYYYNNGTAFVSMFQHACCERRRNQMNHAYTQPLASQARLHANARRRGRKRLYGSEFSAHRFDEWPPVGLWFCKSKLESPGSSPVYIMRSLKIGDIGGTQFLRVQQLTFFRARRL